MFEFRGRWLQFSVQGYCGKAIRDSNSRRVSCPDLLNFSHGNILTRSSGDAGHHLFFSPAVVQEDVVIELPAERDQVETRSLPRFTELWSHVYGEIQKAKQGCLPEETITMIAK